MNRRFFSINLFLLLLLILVACSPVTSESNPGVNDPTIEMATAVPATEEPTPTAEIIDQPAPTIEVVEPAPTEVIIPTAESEVQAPTALCPDFPRPALILSMAEDYLLFDPASGETCTLEFDENVTGGMVAAVGEDFFTNSHTTGPEGAATIIQRISLDGAIEELPYTTVDTEHGSTLVNFVVSPDGRFIAWSVIDPAAGSDFPSSSLSIADIETGITMGSAGYAAGPPRALQPIRFSDDGSILYYALQPYGIGGSWIGFAGRYDNLYAMPTDGSGAPELLFDCANVGTGLCLGDFFLHENTVTGLAYINQDRNAVVIENGEGTILNTLESEEQYVGYPTWGPGGEFVYYTADIADTESAPVPVEGILHRVVPHTTPGEILLSDPALLLPVRYLNDTQVVVQWLAEDGSWGLALVGANDSVQVFDLPTGAYLIDIAAISTQLSSG